jgi:cation:H+ antiporter
VALGFPEWLADFSFFLLATSLVLPLLMVFLVWQVLRWKQQRKLLAVQGGE